ncbi:hypothetical protein FGG08_007277 [Glutinoglossum americanum]|uniref:LIM zinc-binding domain-containing protein n=1 Tax=Glutinoglossum americanum TaxID=1670608 RepID=A0A9P8KZI9_9PEZI|nr:hypothetical protein FGG08_007277 [Glutinoglossum americanum]
MDPVSMIASITSLVVGCAKIVQIAQGAYGIHKAASLTISSISTECVAVSASLSYLQSLVVGNSGSLDPHIANAFETVIVGCTLTLSVLNEYIMELAANKEVLDMAPASRMAKAKLMWNESEMKELLQQLRGHQSSITLLLTVLRNKNELETQDLLKKNHGSLKLILSRARTSRGKMPPSLVSGSALSSSNTGAVLNDTESALSETSFEFDDVLINSRAYRQALMRKMENPGARGSRAETTVQVVQPGLHGYEDSLVARGSTSVVDTVRATQTSPRNDERGLVAWDFVPAVDAARATQFNLSKDQQGLVDLEFDPATYVVQSTRLELPKDQQGLVDLEFDPATDAVQSTRFELPKDGRNSTQYPAVDSVQAIQPSLRGSNIGLANQDSADTTQAAQLILLHNEPSPTAESAGAALATRLVPHVNDSRNIPIENLFRFGRSQPRATDQLNSPTPGATCSSQQWRRLCKKCGGTISGQFVRALGGNFHLECFTCKDCDLLVASRFFPIDDEEGNGQYPLCEVDFFRRLDLLCFLCGGALRDSYITALDRKYHMEHFKCSICHTIFGAQDRYYEHEGNVYCHYHYSTQFAQRCNGCQSAILKQFVDIVRNGQTQIWHPECYMIHKFWNVRFAPSSTTGNYAPQGGVDAADEEREALREREERMEEKTYRAWGILSTFEESSAACISDMILYARDGAYVGGALCAKEFICGVILSSRSQASLQDNGGSLLVAAKDTRHRSKKAGSYRGVAVAGDRPGSFPEVAVEDKPSRRTQIGTRESQYGSSKSTFGSLE